MIKLPLDSVFVLTQRIIMHKIGLQTIPKTIFPFATNNLSEPIIVSAPIMRHFGKLSFNFTTTNWSYRRRQQLLNTIFSSEAWLVSCWLKANKTGTIFSQALIKKHFCILMPKYLLRVIFDNVTNFHPEYLVVLSKFPFSFQTWIPWIFQTSSNQVILYFPPSSLAPTILHQPPAPAERSDRLITHESLEMYFSLHLTNFSSTPKNEFHVLLLFHYVFTSLVCSSN